MLFLGKIYNLPKNYLFYKPYTLLHQNQIISYYKKSLYETTKTTVLNNNVYMGILFRKNRKKKSSDGSWEMLERKNL